MIPLIIIRDRYLVKSVLEFESYMGYLLFIVIVLVCGYFLLAETLSALLAGTKKQEKEVGKINKINLLQIGLLVATTVLFVLTPYADTHNSSLAANCIVIAALLLLMINIVVGIVALCKAKKECRLEIIRNMLLSIPVFLVSHWQYAIYTYMGEEEIFQNSELNTMYEKSVTLMPEWIAATVVIALIILVIFKIIKKYK